jgi:hypothetical protein
MGQSDLTTAPPQADGVPLATDEACAVDSPEGYHGLLGENLVA